MRIPIIPALGLAVFIGGCASQPLTALRDAEPQGSAYSRALRAEYQRFATVELEEMLDFKDADHFAKKGLAAARGGEPAPELLTAWQIAADDAAPLQSARNRLAAALANRRDGAATETAAAAQAGYDCWIEQAEEGYQPRDIARCRARYRDAVALLEARGDYPHGVFFDFDDARLSPTAQSRVQKLAARARHLDVPRITVLGHADSSGGAAHNLALSLRRADAVRRALIHAGVPRGQVAVAASGERRLRIATGDNAREARNRRVDILFQAATAW
jgi:OOP family OmpA-OmpF porin